MEDRDNFPGGLKNLDAVEQQPELLFIRSGVADNMEVGRERNLLYICDFVIVKCV